MDQKITVLHLYYHKRGSTRLYRRTIKPGRKQDPKSIQLMIGRHLLDIQDTALYYYVVATLQTADGETRYRTIIGKHKFHESEGEWVYSRD